MILNIDRLRKPASFQAWFCGIALNVCHRLLQEHNREVWSWETLGGGQLVNLGSSWDPSPEDLAEIAEIRRRMRSAIRTLPTGQRSAVIFYYLSGLTYRETAALLNTSVNAIKARLHKGRENLRKQLLDLWEGETMPEESRTQFVPMRVIDARRAQSAAHPSRFVVLLEEVKGTRRLPIWVGRSEATWIALSLEQKKLLRPGTFQFANNLLTAAGGQLKEVRITRLADHTFYAEVIVEVTTGTRTVDARPSDALNLALLVGAPIAVDARVLEESQRAGCYQEFTQGDYPDGPRELIAEIEPTQTRPQ